ncbi:unnamed protein product, partial [Polarella glacialis]
AGRARLPLLVLDSMLPGQELDFWTDDKTYLALMADVGVGGSLGMLGMDPRTRNVLRHGVEVTVTACQPRDGGVYTVLSGQRVFRLQTSSAPQPVGRWRRAYAEGSEEIALGWGQEQFVEAALGSFGLTEVFALCLRGHSWQCAMPLLRAEC